MVTKGQLKALALALDEYLAQELGRTRAGPQGHILYGEEARAYRRAEARRRAKARREAQALWEQAKRIRPTG